MSILVTGGRGKTSSSLCAMLDEAKVPFLVASRSNDSASRYHQVKFDWSDKESHKRLLTTTQIKAAYIIPPYTDDMAKTSNEFIELARAYGVKRFVVMSSSGQEPGSPMHGEIHKHILNAGIDYTVLRPTWFMENFVGAPLRLDPKKSLEIYSATGGGKVPWVACEDIAAVAFRALVNEKPHNTDHIILGPELLSYEDIAATLSEVSGRNFRHRNITEAELQARFVDMGVPEAYAGMLSKMDTAISNKGEEKLYGVVEKVTGRKPKTFRAFVEANKDAEVVAKAAVKAGLEAVQGKDTSVIRVLQQSDIVRLGRTEWPDGG